MDKNTVDDLRAVVMYLRIVGAVYPIAPEKAIETIERVIGILSQTDAQRREMQAP